MFWITTLLLSTIPHCRRYIHVLYFVEFHQQSLYCRRRNMLRICYKTILYRKALYTVCDNILKRSSTKYRYKSSYDIYFYIHFIGKGKTHFYWLCITFQRVSTLTHSTSAGLNSNLCYKVRVSEIFIMKLEK